MAKKDAANPRPSGSKRSSLGPLGAAFVALGLPLGLASIPASAEPVDLELIIATDVSRSISREEAQLQRQGVADAFRSAEVVRAIQAGALGKIGIAYIDWSTEFDSRVVVNWQLVHDAFTATGFADALLRAPPTTGRRTSISSAILFATQLIETNDLEGARRTIDLSGDGPNNYGLSLAPVREEVLAKGITINGLPIIVEGAEFSGRGYFPEVDKYYAGCVIGGQSAFLIVARGFEDFALAIRRKLVMEISDLAPEREPAGEGTLMTAAAAPYVAQSTPAMPVPSMVPAPRVRETDCDRWSGGFGGFDNFGGFGR